MLDLLISGGRVIDGAGNPWYEADVGVEDGLITEVGRVGESGATTIDAHGLVVCPGFIDMHTHSDIQLLANPAHEAKVHQGVTLDVIGQDGLSFAPVNDSTLSELRMQLAGWNDDPPGFDWDWRTRRGVPRPLRPRGRRDQRRLPRSRTARCACSRWASTTAHRPSRSSPR